MALRCAGRHEEALGELSRADRELDRAARNPTYPLTTRMFLRYEQARTLLAVDRPYEALGAVRDARDLAGKVGWRLFPALLRTEVWIHRALGDQAAARRTLGELSERVGERASPTDRLILQEARGPARDDGVVF